ncbi:hypothetical protein Vadar_023796 [Vaccinium darrowii]|uniref:Uncharacterized protein n=1 Tax=Vaccinium darrowii TaxID=229202 RepID=A0ACB7XBU6_9ERIC|nr:hypothetical protein Vadar_023796 [Vaccinium darrowii]
MPVARPESSGARVIAHVDMDCFYVQVEQRKQPHLRGQPTAVVQYNSWKGGGLIAVGYEARKDGVKRSMRGDEAKKACPQIQLVQVPVARGKADLTTYRNAGSEVVSILSRKGRCERASIDEVYLDLTDAAEAMLAESPPESLERIDEEALKSHVLGLNEDGGNLKANAREWFQRSEADHRDKLLACGAIIVAELRMQVLKETEFTCSAGIAHNKMLAKLASGMNKPAQQTVVPFASVEGLLEPLPIKKMKQLGGKLGSSLQIDLGVNTVGELLQFSEEKLQERYGVNTGTWLWNIARGISGEEVQGRLLPKSHGSGKTFPGPQALKTIASVEHWLNELCEELSERLQSDLDLNKRIAHTLTLHATAFKSSDSESHRNFPSKSCPLRYGPTKIKEDALNLFQAALREYIGSSGVSTHGSRSRGWGITSLSVSASKIVAVPTGTHSIMRYFHGQDRSCCSSEQVKDRLIPEAAPLSPSGTKSYSGSHPTELPIEYREETRISGAMRIVDEKETNEELCIREDVCDALQPDDGQDSSCSSQGAPHEFIKETSAVSSSGTRCCMELNQNELHMESQAEETGTKCSRHGTRPREQKRKMVKDKGSSSILRFFQNCNNSSSPKQEHARNTDETQASSSSSFQSTGTFSELNEADVPKENSLGMPTLGQQDELRRDAWDYKIDEIDPTVFNELPPQIQQELRAWLRPQKRANIPKRDTSQPWLKMFFNKYGVVKEVFIPEKRSKATGNRFGFIRYDCPVSADLAVLRTNGVWLDDKKLFVKLASFEAKKNRLSNSIREGEIYKAGMGHTKKHDSRVNVAFQNHSSLHNNGNAAQGLSFAQVLRGAGETSLQNKFQSKQIQATEDIAVVEKSPDIDCSIVEGTMEEVTDSMKKMADPLEVLVDNDDCTTVDLASDDPLFNCHLVDEAYEAPSVQPNLSIGP